MGSCTTSIFFLFSGSNGGAGADSGIVICLPSAAPIGTKVQLATCKNTNMGFKVIPATLGHIITRFNRSSGVSISGSAFNCEVNLKPFWELTYISQSLWYITDYSDACTAENQLETLSLGFQ